jgi:hypothetical protein
MKEAAKWKVEAVEALFRVELCGKWKHKSRKEGSQ